MSDVDRMIEKCAKKSPGLEAEVEADLSPSDGHLRGDDSGHPAHAVFDDFERGGALYRVAFGDAEGLYLRGILSGLP
jgi:hypothetical protein